MFPFPPTTDWVYDFEIEARKNFREGARCYGPDNEFVPPNYLLSPCCAGLEFNSITRTCTPSARQGQACAITTNFGQDLIRTLETEYVGTSPGVSLFDGAECKASGIAPAGRPVFATARYK